MVQAPLSIRQISVEILDRLLMLCWLLFQERPYVCDQCGDAFTRSDSLQQHVQLHCGIDMPESVASSGPKVVQLQTTAPPARTASVAELCPSSALPKPVFVDSPRVDPIETTASNSQPRTTASPMEVSPSNLHTASMAETSFSSLGQPETIALPPVMSSSFKDTHQAELLASAVTPKKTFKKGSSKSPEEEVAKQHQENVIIQRDDPGTLQKFCLSGMAVQSNEGNDRDLIQNAQMGSSSTNKGQPSNFGHSPSPVLAIDQNSLLLGKVQSELPENFLQQDTKPDAAPSASDSPSRHGVVQVTTKPATEEKLVPRRSLVSLLKRSSEMIDEPSDDAPPKKWRLHATHPDGSIKLSPIFENLSNIVENTLKTS